VVEPRAELDGLAPRSRCRDRSAPPPGFLESVYEEVLCVELALHETSLSVLQRGIKRVVQTQ